MLHSVGVVIRNGQYMRLVARTKVTDWCRNIGHISVPSPHPLQFHRQGAILNICGWRDVGKLDNLTGIMNMSSAQCCRSSTPQCIQFIIELFYYSYNYFDTSILINTGYQFCFSCYRIFTQNEYSLYNVAAVIGCLDWSSWHMCTVSDSNLFALFSWHNFPVLYWLLTIFRSLTFNDLLPADPKMYDKMRPPKKDGNLEWINWWIIRNPIVRFFYYPRSDNSLFPRNSHGIGFHRWNINGEHFFMPCTSLWSLIFMENISHN